MKRTLAVGLIILLPLVSCTSRNEVFDEAISRARGTSQAVVNPVGDGLPYFTTGTLNPTWEEKGQFPIVQFPDVEWRDQLGTLHRKEYFENRNTIVAFFFSTCTGFCPMMVQKLKRMEKELRGVPNLQFVAISVDPEVDTPARLEVYAKAQGVRPQTSFKFFTSSQSVLDRIVHETFATQVVARKNSSLRSFAHSEHFYLLDQQGRLRGVLNGSRIDAPQDARKMLVALAEGKPSS